MDRRRFFKWLAASVIGLGAFGGGRHVIKRSSQYYDGPKSDHFNGENFFNPGGAPPGKFADLLKWQFGREGEKAEWPEFYPSPYDDALPEPRVDGGRLKISMVGHATLLIQTQGLNFVTDPVWAERASPFQFAGPKRANPPGIRFENLPPIDVVLLSHNHYDHLDLTTLKRLVKRDNPKIVTPLGNDRIVLGKATKANCIARDWGEAVEVKPGVRIHFEPCHHWSARGFFDRRKALWAAFVIETPAGKIYHIGDTGYHEGINYRDAAKKHGPFRTAILPIGAYEPRWFMKAQHQNPDEAVRGHMACAARTSIAHHWGTFQLTDEAIEAPIKALEVALEKHGVSEQAFRVLRPGEFWEEA